VNGIPCILFLLLQLQIDAQRNRIKAGFLGFPAASGFGLGSFGYERLGKKLTSSWQVLLNGSGGEIGNDTGPEKRIWGTVEKTFYKKTISERITWSYSFFTEAGKREKDAGHAAFIPERTFNKRKTFEICPGASIGLQYRIGNRWRLEATAGPKIILANGDEYYYNNITKNIFSEKYSATAIGLRLNGLLSYQF